MPPDPRTRPSNLAEIDRLARVVAKDPGSKAFMPLAEEYGKAGMWPEAVSVLEDGLKIYPGFVTAMVALGRAYDQMNQPVKAKVVLEEAVKASPENLRAHRTLAKIYAAQGAIDAARQSCAVILSANPHDQEALSLCATLEAASVSMASTLSPVQLRPMGTDEAGTEPPTLVSNKTSELIEGTGSPPDRSQIVDAVDVQTHSEHPSRAIIGRLEGWLASVRARRRDRSGAHGSETPTS